MKRLKSDSQPATKGDVRRSQEELAQMVAKSFQTVATKDDLKRFATKDDLKRFATKDDLKRFATKDDLRNDLEKFKDEIIHEFKVVTENIHKDVAGANADEISLIKDQTLPDHEQRLQRVERKAGLPVGPQIAN